ncbi:MAG TPA: carboxypeptidase-like regulatory domain-containing protein [Terriglobales bacterium]|nr:carboxypeptidase-like regulatory domain-containing protein [Terriglobales bacterium]
MRKSAGLVAVIVLLGMMAAGSPAPKNEPQTRTLTGQVTDKADVPLSGAIVYLQDTRTQVVKTYITDDKGNYRFSSLSPNVDYQVRAEYQGRKSDTKTLSSFDSRSNVTLHLKINMAK